jgi:glutathione S-transferase
MILYDSPSPAPNPRRVRIFAAEKGIALDLHPVSLLAREHKSPEHLTRNPIGQTPVLVLDDGTAISESMAICRYLEALHRAPPLFGSTALEIGGIEMWIRRTEFILGGPVRAFWVNAHPLTEQVVPLRFPDFGKANVAQALAAMAIFDTALGETKFIAGNACSVADIVLLTTFDFAGFIGLTIPDDLTNLRRWLEDVSARPSAMA